MSLKLENAAGRMDAPPDVRARPYARPASVQPRPVGSPDVVQLERPPHSVPPAATRVVYAAQPPNLVYEAPVQVQTTGGLRYAVVPGREPRVREFLQARAARPPAPAQTPPAAAEIVLVSEEEVQKCARFLRSLVIRVFRDTAKYTRETAESVRELVKAVVEDAVTPHAFTERLAVLLGTKPQPQLEPFLAKNLPALRAGLRAGRYALDLDEPPAEPPAPPPPPAAHVVYTTLPQQFVVKDERVLEQPMVEQQVYILPSSGGITISTADGRPLTTSAFVHQPPVEQPVEQKPLEALEPKKEPEEAVEQDVEEEEPVAEAPPMPPLPFTILDSAVLWARLAAEVPGCEAIEPAVVARLAESVEWRLGELLGELSATAAHRLEPLRLNPHFEQVSDPRRQLRFVEQVERAAHERQAAAEKDALLKAAKGKQKDASEKAKEMKRANQEDAANREANEAAIAALGGRGTKRPFAPPADPLRNAATAGLHVPTHRPRVCRVTLRDLQFVLHCAPVPAASTLKFQVAYGQVRLPSALTSDF
ncbi:TAFH domain-containing protein [Aphelenchoides fujianensis]|nr:TAFH domain-containing protein [Aphelenchoides fujianensis]